MGLVVTPLDWAPIFEWYMARCLVENGQHNNIPSVQFGNIEQRGHMDGETVNVRFFYKSQLSMVVY